MTEKKENRGFSNFGFSTILLSFVMICVVTFSALTLVSAYSDYKLSKKVAAKTLDYYNAEELAYERIALVDETLQHCYFAQGNKTRYYDTLSEVLSPYGEIITKKDCYYLSFQEPIAEDHHLSVVLLLHYPKADAEPFFEIVEWKSVYTREYTGDDTLDLIQ